MYEKELQRILTASQNNALTFFCWRRRIGTLRSTNLEERYEKRLEQERPVLDALLSWANEMQGKTAPKSALGRAIGSAPFLDFASKAYRKKARKAIHQV